MNERPLMCTPELAQKIAEGKKIQTCRPVRIPQGRGWRDPMGYNLKAAWIDYSFDSCYLHVPTNEPVDDLRTVHRLYCSYGEVGDAMYIRETFAIDVMNAERRFYKGRNDRLPNTSYKWRPSIHMPKWAARTYVKITNLACRRIQEISEKECKSEGVEKIGFLSYRECFQKLWNSIYEEQGDGWEANPLVWMINFTLYDNGKKTE